MMIRVPSQISVYGPGYGGSLYGLYGLGQELDAGGLPIDTTIPDLPIDTTPIVPTDTTGLPPGELISPTGGGGGGGGLTVDQISKILGTAAQGAVGIVRSTSSPYVIPGTNSVYDPATGRILAPGQSNIATPLVSGTISNTGLLVGGAVVIGILAMLFMKK